MVRLIDATETKTSGAANARWVYGYDNADNRTSQTRSGSAGGAADTTNYGYNDADQLVSRNGSYTGLGYDATGNEQANPGEADLGVPARGAAYTSRDQPASTTTTPAGGPSTVTAFSYTGPTNNSRLTAGSTERRNSMLGLTATTGDQPASYIRTPGGTLIAQRTAGTTNYYLTDNLGSTYTISAVVRGGVQDCHQAEIGAGCGFWGPVSLQRSRWRTCCRAGIWREASSC